MILSDRFFSGWLTFSLFFIFHSCLLSIEVSAVVRWNEPVQITTHPGDDFAASAPEDGSFLVYVSDRSGNLDLWIKPLGPGVHPPDRKLTSHSSEDNYPAVSPDGERVAFISHRRDPKGDIYLMDLDDVEADKEKEEGAEDDEFAVRLTDAEFPESDPVWSPDQKFIYFTSSHPESNELRIFRLNVKTRERELVTNIMGLNPAVSPDGRYLVFVSSEEFRGLWIQDLTTHKRIRVTSERVIEASPKWSSDSKRIFFTRYQDDTDKDGKLTINDRPNLWSVEFEGGLPGKFRQLTDSATYDLLPVQVGNRVLFTSTRHGSSDVWAIPDEGLAPRKELYGQGLQIVEDLCSDIEKYSYPCLLADQNLLNDFDGEESLSRIRYRLARGYKKLGHMGSARETYKDILVKHPEDMEYRGLSEIDLLLIDLNQSREKGMAVYRKNNQRALGMLAKIIARYKGREHVASRAYLEIGNAYFELDDHNKALENYKKVIKNYPGQRAISAEAAFSQSKVYQTVGDQEKVVHAFVQVVRDYYDVETWTRKAIGEILNIHEKSSSLNKKVSSLQNLVVKYEDLPILAGAIQNRVGELYYQTNENLDAKEAYTKTAERFGQAPRERNEALFALANIYAEEENYDLSLGFYEKVAEGSQGLAESRERSREGFIRKSIAKGEWELKVGETKLALKTFLKLIASHPETVEAHRGYLQAAAALGKIKPAIEFYDKRIDTKTPTAVDLYGYGLAHTYLDPPDLEEAREKTEEALGINSQIVYYHQTLGWIFEQMERAAPREGYLERALHEYEIALALNDEEEFLQNEANLLLNMGNGHFLLKNSSEAYYYYNRRLESGREFLNEDREAIFHQRFGESAFKAGHSEKAVEEFKKSLAMVSKKKDLSRMAELNDRIALAYQDAGKNKEAVDYFSKTLELHEKTGNTVSLSKALRNIANNLYMLSEKKQKDPAGSLNDALSKYFNAIENLEKFGIAEKKKKESSAMLTIDVEASLSEDASTAAQGFDMSGEQKLIFHYVGKIYGDFGEYDRAIEYFEKKLAFIPDKLDPKENIPVLLEKALLLNQLGNYHYLSGRYDRAAEYFKESYATSKLLDNRQGIAVNAANLGRLFLLKSRLKPARSLQAAMNGALDLIEEASLLLASDDKAFANPEYRVYLKNYLGILYHFQAFHFPVDRPEEKTSANQKMDEKAILNAALESLGEDYSLAKKSRRQFEEARSLAEKLDGPQRGQILVALRQNLDLANYLSLAKTDKLQPDADTAGPDLLFSQWQFKYLKAMMAQGKERFNLLKEADRLLTELPYGYTRGPASLPMQEDLYQALTEISFNDKHFRDALRYSEKGLQQNLITLRQEVPLQLDDPVRKKAYEKLTSLSKSLSEIAREDEAGSERIKNILAEYNKNLADLKKKDPRFAALFYPSVPDIKQAQKLLPAGRVYLKLQKSGNRVLLWVVDSKEFQGGVIPENEKLLQILARLGRYGAKAQPGDLEFLSETFFSPLQQVLASAKSLIIEAAGEMEFLPWPAMLLDGKPIIQKMPITFQSSLSQFYESQINKNLYNSRLLTVEADAETYKTVSGNFASARNLAGEKSTVKNFRQDFKKFGVVSVNSRTYLGGLSSARSFISLTNRRNHFERMRLEDLFRHSVESNFIALNDVEFELQPDSGISPTASLIQGLTYMGYPGILLNTGPVDKKTHADFQKLFFSSFRKGNPAESLRQAQLKLMQANPESLAWTQYRFYGFPGMTEQEKNQFAKAEYLNNATKGNEALTKHQDFSAAIGYLEKALVLIDFLPEEAGGAKIIYMGLGEAAYAMKDFKKAVDYQTRAVELVEAEGEEADLEELAQAQFKLGIYYSEAEDFIPAVENLNKALAFYEEYEFGAELAHGYSELGKVEESAVKYDRALKAFTASAKISGQEDVAMDFDKGQQLRNIGKIYLKRLNRYDEAAKYYAEANKVFLKLDHKEMVAETWLEMGLVAEKQSNFDEALNFYAKAEKLSHEQNLKATLSKAMLYQGNTHWFQGNYQNAFRYQKQALNIAGEIKDKEQLTSIHNTLGLIYWTLNDSERSLSDLNTGLELATERGSVLDQASAYNNIGLVYRKDKEYEKSIEFFNKALEKDVELKSKWGQGYTHRNLGMSFMRLGQLDQAETHIKKAIALSSEIKNNTNLVKAKLELGNLALERNNCKEAIPIFQETAKLAAGYNIPEVNWRALQGEGSCLAKSNRRAEAIKAYKKAVAVVDQMRAAIKVEEFQNGFLTDKQDVYQELILLLLDEGKTEESFNFLERSKSRSFIDLLGNQKLSLKDDISQKLYDNLVQQKKTIRSIEDAAARIEDEEGKKKKVAELVRARNKYQDLLIEAKEQNPELSSFVTVEAMSLKELYTLLEKDVALVEYMVAKGELVAWVISKGQINVVRTPVKASELNSLIADYRQRIQRLAPLEEQSVKLFNLVIKPVEALLAGKKVVGIVPHGYLHYLSFASLFDGEAYFLERHPLFYSPSASVLKYTFGRNKKFKGPIKVLALGNPDLGTLNYDLPLAEMEAKAIRWDYPEVTVLTREKATESWLKEHISEYQIIHIASHGEFDPINPLFSSLKLAKDDKADGNFEVNEVFSLEINADLVTLSACQTGLGDIKGGDELVGLNRAFIYAGTHALISSLWRVSDISTAILIKRFYRNYARDNKGESLRKAQLLVKKLYPHPAYWAGFNLTGDYR